MSAHARARTHTHTHTHIYIYIYTLFQKYALHVEGGTGGVHAEFMEAICQAESFGKVKLRPVKDMIIEAKMKEHVRVIHPHIYAHIY